MIKKKYLVLLFTLFLILPVAWVVNAIKDDKKDNIPDSIEKFIPLSVKNFLLENIFYKKNYMRHLKIKEKISDKRSRIKC